MNKSVSIHANSGNNVGLGHLVRCTTLAQELESRNVDVLFHLKPDDRAISFVRKKGIEPKVSDSESVCKAIQASASDIAVIDSYEFNQANFRLLKREKDIVVLDELGNRSIPANLVINNNLYASGICYPDAAKVLRGPDYCMLREEFRDLTKPTYSVPPNHVLLTIGGADLTEDFSSIINTVGEVLPAETVLDIIVGPYFDDVSIRTSSINLHRNPDNISELMIRADLAVSGGGQTLYELATCGTPAAAITLGDDQVKNIKAFAEHGFCLDVGRGTHSKLRVCLKQALQRLLDLETRQKMGRRGRELVDGNGVLRVADQISSL